MSGQPEVSLRAELDRCLIIAATVGNKWLLYTVNRDVLTRRRPPTLREGIFLVLVFVCICVAFASSHSALFFALLRLAFHYNVCWHPDILPTLHPHPQIHSHRVSLARLFTTHQWGLFSCCLQ